MDLEGDYASPSPVSNRKVVKISEDAFLSSSSSFDLSDNGSLPKRISQI